MTPCQLYGPKSCVCVCCGGVCPRSDCAELQCPPPCERLSASVLLWELVRDRPHPECVFEVDAIKSLIKCSTVAFAKRRFRDFNHRSPKQNSNDPINRSVAVAAAAGGNAIQQFCACTELIYTPSNDNITGDASIVNSCRFESPSGFYLNATSYLTNMTVPGG